VPKVEDRNVKTGGPDWSVAGFTRQSAHEVTKTNGSPNWGGTYSDKAVVDACKFLHESGYEVMLYPMLYLDLPNKPWRGDVKVKSSCDLTHG
jgi:hypothetical protein